MASQNPRLAKVPTVNSKKLEHGCRMIYAGSASFCCLGLEDGHVPTLWPLLYSRNLRVSSLIEDFWKFWEGQRSYIRT